MIYAYATMDTAVGRLTADEVEFLEARNARVLEVVGRHGSMIDEDSETQRIVDALATPVTAPSVADRPSTRRLRAHSG